MIKPLCLLCSLLLPLAGYAAEPEGAAVSAGELAGRMAAKQQDGASLIRLKMDTKGSGTLQLQVKSRASRGGAEAVYQVLWPKERKGEAVLISRNGGRVSATQFTPPDSVRPLEPRQPLFGGDLAAEDVVDDFYSWDQQAIVGNEVVDRVNCVILESKPGKGRSSYSSVRSWIDARKLVPMRIEKYGGSGKPVRVIETTRVAADDRGRPIPANLVVRGPDGSTTEIDGSRIKHGVNFTDAEFTAQGLRQMGAAKDAPE